MRIGDLTMKLKPWAHVTIKDFVTKKTVWSGEAWESNFNDNVKYWDFSKGYVIYI